jgi:hypothetical protein
MAEPQNSSNWKESLGLLNNIIGIVGGVVGLAFFFAWLGGLPSPFLLIFGSVSFTLLGVFMVVRALVLNNRPIESIGTSLTDVPELQKDNSPDKVSGQIPAKGQTAPTRAQLTEQIEKLEGQKTSLESRWKEHVFLNSWLLNMAGEQAQGIRSHVEVQKVYFCYQELETPMLKCVFGINFINKSVYNISVEGKVGGHIEVNGTPLAEPPLIISPSGTIALGDIGVITLEQRLTRAEADFIASKDPKTIEYNLSKLLLTIKGERFAEREGQYLEIPKGLHKDPQAEIDSLKSEIAGLSQNHAETIKRLERERQYAEFQIWRRVKVTRVLSEVMGYGKAIGDRCDLSNMEYPRDEIEEWARRLWDVLRWCFEEADIETFYSKIDSKCPGYERGPVRIIKIPEQNAERHLWFHYHLKRLSELINEQQHTATIVREEEDQD